MRWNLMTFNEMKIILSRFTMHHTLFLPPRRLYTCNVVHTSLLCSKKTKMRHKSILCCFFYFFHSRRIWTFMLLRLYTALCRYSLCILCKTFSYEKLWNFAAEALLLITLLSLNNKSQFKLLQSRSWVACTWNESAASVKLDFAHI